MTHQSGLLYLAEILKLFHCLQRKGEVSILKEAARAWVAEHAGGPSLGGLLETIYRTTCGQTSVSLGLLEAVSTAYYHVMNGGAALKSQGCSGCHMKMDWHPSLWSC